LANVADEETVIELKKEIRPILEKVAHNRSLITYGALASEAGPKVGISGLIPRDTRLHRALDEVSIDSFRRDGHLLAVLVVNKRSQRPGPGFFGLAKERLREEGLRPPYRTNLGDEAVFQDALNKVYDHYRQ
jgi:hypothetical protein